MGSARAKDDQHWDAEGVALAVAVSVQAQGQQGEDAGPGDTGKGPGKSTITIKLTFYHHAGGIVLLMTRESGS